MGKRTKRKVTYRSYVESFNNEHVGIMKMCLSDKQARYPMFENEGNNLSKEGLGKIVIKDTPENPNTQSNVTMFIDFGDTYDKPLYKIKFENKGAYVSYLYLLLIDLEKGELNDTYFTVEPINPQEKNKDIKENDKEYKKYLRKLNEYQNRSNEIKNREIIWTLIYEMIFKSEYSNKQKGNISEDALKHYKSFMRYINQNCSIMNKNIKAIIGHIDSYASYTVLQKYKVGFRSSNQKDGRSYGINSVAIDKESIINYSKTYLPEYFIKYLKSTYPVW